MGGELVLLNHDDQAGPGWLLDRVVDHVQFHRVIRIDTKADLPPPNECNGVVFTSHTLDPAAIAARDRLIREEVIFVRTLIGLGVPFLGIDGGAQLLARAILGKVLEEPRTACGSAALVLEDSAKDDPLFGPEMGRELTAINWPTQRIELTPRAVLLAGTEESPVIFRVNEWAYGVVAHLEATPTMFTTWLDQQPEMAKERQSLVAAAKEDEAKQKLLAYRVMNRFVERTQCFCHDEPPVNAGTVPSIPL